MDYCTRNVGKDSRYGFVLRQGMLGIGVSVSLVVFPGVATGMGVSFHDIATEVGSGITYKRVPSARDAIFERVRRRPVLTFDTVAETPEKARGVPGIAIAGAVGRLLAHFPRTSP